MSVCLLDVNVLIAAVWPGHRQHELATAWFRDHAEEGFATCALTQAAFIRIISNPAFSLDALTPRNAIALLNRNLAHPRHTYWPTEIGFCEAVAQFSSRIVGHRQVTDAYLLGLVIRQDGKLVTFEKGVKNLLSQASGHYDKVVVLGG